MVPIDFRPGVEQAFAAVDPLVRYAAFLRHDAARLQASELVRAQYGDDGRLVLLEADRLRRRNAAAWDAGAGLLSSIGLPSPAG
jgi:hypothetical protein